MSSLNRGKILSQHLNIIYKAREAFIMNENSEKIPRALRHNVRANNYNIIVSGDSVHYKRASDRRWKWTAVVLGKYIQVPVNHDCI